MKKTLVIGASLKPERYSNLAINRLVRQGHAVHAIGQKKGMVAGVDVHTQILPFTGIHTVTLYINPGRQKPYYEYVASLKPERVIFNPGTENAAFQKYLQKNTIETEVACTLVLLATHTY
ncbi:MAG: CoA-binding protein [Marinirhabdus sp.]